MQLHHVVPQAAQQREPPRHLPPHARRWHIVRKLASGENQPDLLKWDIQSPGQLIFRVCPCRPRVDIQCDGSAG